MVQTWPKPGLFKICRAIGNALYWEGSANSNSIIARGYLFIAW